MSDAPSLFEIAQQAYEAHVERMARKLAKREGWPDPDVVVFVMPNTMREGHQWIAPPAGHFRAVAVNHVMPPCPVWTLYKDTAAEMIRLVKETGG